MKVIFLGSKLLNFVTVHNWAELRYYATIVKIQSESTIKKQGEHLSFRRYFEKRLKNIGVNVKNFLKVKKFIIDCEVVKDWVMMNKMQKMKILSADRCLQIIHKENDFILKALKIYFLSHFTIFRNKKYSKYRIEKIAIQTKEKNNIIPKILSRAGKLLRDVINSFSFSDFLDSKCIPSPQSLLSIY